MSKPLHLEAGTGAIPDLFDERDFLYTDVMGAMPEEKPVDWDKGYDAHEALKIPVVQKDQNGSLSCVGQGISTYTRRIIVSLGGDPDVLSARDVYSKIRLSKGGAYIRDGMLVVANSGILKESIAPDYDEGQPPSEEFMSVDPRTTDDLKNEAKKLDKFSARMIPGGSDIDIYAHAIQNNHGVVTGFTGTNGGWSKPIVSPPKIREQRWGHCVDAPSYGRLDFEQDDIKKGTRCLFIPNSWGGRYTITKGRWKGLQAIPEDYFLYAEKLIADKDPIAGILVFNSWVLVPDEVLPDNVKAMDIIKRNQNRLIQITKISNENDPEQRKLKGAFVGIVVGDYLRTIDTTTKPTEYEKLLLTLAARQTELGLGTGISYDDYLLLPKKPL